MIESYWLSSPSQHLPFIAAPCWKGNKFVKWKLPVPYKQKWEIYTNLRVSIRLIYCPFNTKVTFHTKQTQNNNKTKNKQTKKNTSYHIILPPKKVKPLYHPNLHIKKGPIFYTNSQAGTEATVSTETTEALVHGPRWGYPRRSREGLGWGPCKNPYDPWDDGIFTYNYHKNQPNVSKYTMKWILLDKNKWLFHCSWVGDTLPCFPFNGSFENLLQIKMKKTILYLKPPPRI